MKYIYTLFAILTSSLLLAQPTTQPTAPTLAQADVISVFSDSYDEPPQGVNGSYNFDPNWGQLTVCTVETIGGGEVIKMANLNYQGLQYPTVDVSSKGKIHLDYFIEGANTTSLRVFVIKEGQGVETGVNIPITVVDQWVSADIDLSDYSDASIDLTGVNQIKIDGSGTVYFDNIYFHGTPPAPPAQITGETLDFTDVSEKDKFSANNASYVFEHVTTGGNTGGALKAGTQSGAGDWRLSYYETNYDFTNAAKLKVTFDLKQFSTTLVGASIHFRISSTENTSSLPGTYTGAIQNAGAYNGNTALNANSWTAYEFEADVTNSSSLASFSFNFITGADASHEGVILIDNVVVSLLDSSGNTLDQREIDTPKFVTYPNPLRDVLYIKGSSKVDNVSIYDLMGRNVLKAMPNKSDFNLDVSNLNKGIYMVDLKSAGKTTTIKVVK